LVFIGGCVLLALVLAFSDKTIPLDPRAQVHVAQDDATAYKATVLAPAGLTKVEYLNILVAVHETNMRGRPGFVQVFDDPDAEKLATCWTTRETTIQEDTFCADHIVAQATGTAQH